MADVNAWSIIVPGVVTPAVVAGFAYFQAISARRRSAVDELRVVIDDAARALAEVAMAVLPLWNGWREDTQVAVEYLKDAAVAVRDMRLSADRLVIRLGADAPLSQAHTEAVRRMNIFYQLLHQGLEGERSFDEADHSLLWEGVESSRAAFLSAAQTVVGHDLVRVGSPLHPTLPLPQGRVT